MNTLRIIAIAFAATVLAIPQAFALGGGGFAPGGPLSATMTPSCNGYNMDGTINRSAGADQPGCIDRSINRFLGVDYAPRY